MSDRVISKENEYVKFMKTLWIMILIIQLSFTNIIFRNLNKWENLTPVMQTNLQKVSRDRYRGWKQIQYLIAYNNLAFEWLTCTNQATMGGSIALLSFLICAHDSQTGTFNQ